MRPNKRHHTPRSSFTITRGSGGFLILGPDGCRVGGVYDNREYAETRRESMQRRLDRQRNARQRPCMCCGTEFASEGIHNRLCDPCRGSAGAASSPFTATAAVSLPRR